MQRYLTHLVVVLVILVPSLAGFNWLVNPYKIWNPPIINGVNDTKFQYAAKVRIFKTIGLAKQAAHVVILGTSRSDRGLNPKHDAIGGNGLNLATSSQPYSETRMFFDWCQNNQKPVSTFVIGLDFFRANALLSEPADFDVNNYSARHGWLLLVSISTLIDSVQMIIKRKSIPIDTWSENGLHYRSDDYVKLGGGYRKIMLESEKNYLLDDYLPEPSCSFEFVSPDGAFTPLEEIHAMISRAYREHVDIRLFISPSHARQWETIAASGLWQNWEEWKRRLVKMNEEEARRAGQQPFPLWDFSGYNSISTETVPALGDTSATMRWYYDSSHYSTATGDLLLDRIFNFKAPERSVPDDFGVLLTSANVDAHLARIRSERTEYRRMSIKDVLEIETMARELAKTKNCQ